MANYKIIGVDCGSEQSGIIKILNGAIEKGYNMANSEIVPYIQLEAQGCDKIVVVIEDIRPYNMRITNGIIETIKYIGQLEWRLQSLSIKIELIPRWKVKQWVYLQFSDICTPAIDKKIVYSQKRKSENPELLVAKDMLHKAIIKMDGKGHAIDVNKLREIVKESKGKVSLKQLLYETKREVIPNFVWIDDRMIEKAMRKHWGIQKPTKVGECVAYGIKDHAFQALALVSFFMALK